MPRVKPSVWTMEFGLEVCFDTSSLMATDGWLWWKMLTMREVACSSDIIFR